MKEKDIVNSVIWYVKSYPLSEGCYIFNIPGSALTGKGLPDLIGGYKGKPFAVEVKQPGKTPRPEQLATLTIFKLCGYTVGVVTSVDDFKRLFDD